MTFNREEQRSKNGRARYAALLIRQQFPTYKALTEAETKELATLKKRFAAGELGAIIWSDDQRTEEVQGGGTGIEGGDPA